MVPYADVMLVEAEDGWAIMSYTALGRLPHLVNVAAAHGLLPAWLVLSRTAASCACRSLQECAVVVVGLLPVHCVLSRHIARCKLFHATSPHTPAHVSKDGAQP